MAAGLTCVGAGCGSLTLPPPRELVPLFDLVVPASATVRDTVRIGYAYETSCGPTPKPEVSIGSTTVRVAVWREVPEFPWPCPPITAAIVREEVLLLPRSAAVPVSVRFREPGGADSVRTISYSASSSRAP